MQRRPGSDVPAGEPDNGGSAEPLWLAVGDTAADALEASLSDAPGLTGRLGSAGRPEVLRTTDVHAALSLLAQTSVHGCVVSAHALAARPRAALRSLRRRLQAAPLVVYDAGHAKSARRAAESLGVPVWHAADPTSAAYPADPEAQREEPLGPPAAADPGPPEAPAPLADPPLPRADALPPDTGAVDSGQFAEGCLARIGRVGSLVRYILRTLSEATNASRISLMLREPERDALRLRAGRGINEALLGKVRLGFGAGIAGRVAALGRPVAGHGSTGGTRRYRTSAFVVLPLGRQTQCEGVLNVTGLPENQLPSSDVLKEWTRLCRRGGLALRSARRLQRARSLSTSDSLTGLPNRRAFERALRRELERARRSGAGLVVALLDVDHFKGFNDRYGHQAGDAVLVEVADRLQSAFRETDLVSRWGGEEFAVLLPGLAGGDAGEARRAVERARVGVGGRPFQVAPGLPAVRVTLSGGLAAFPADGSEGEELVRAADRAMYRAKEGGRDRIERA